MAKNQAGTQLGEEQFVLRFADPSLAERVRRALREEDKLASDCLQIEFPESGKAGVLMLDGERHTIALLSLPTVVESYKTYDDTNLVKTGDIGQVLLVGGQVAPGQEESLDGVTPPMNNARQRHFKQVPSVEPAVVARVEADLLSILQGGAPSGYEFHDVEEEYVVDPKTKVGTWQMVKPTAKDKADKEAGDKEKAKDKDKAKDKAKDKDKDGDKEGDKDGDKTGDDGEGGGTPAGKDKSGVAPSRRQKAKKDKEVKANVAAAAAQAAMAAEAAANVAAARQAAGASGS
ncbi:hypothetical protein FOA52_002372 [Chlamydomonas sp. UWO 241]|nr:hypothetical protein FOA52_002372 [Chlamydomonas sp. UWO 241]